MKKNYTLLILVITALVVSGCSPAPATQPPQAPTKAPAAAPAKAPTAAPTTAPAAAPTAARIIPRFINHPAPEFSTSIGAFTFGGCNAETGACPPDSVIGQLGCQRVVARDLYGGLTPAVPAAWCIVETGQPGDMEAFDLVNDQPPYYRGILIYNNNQYYLAANPSTVQDLYAPLESPEEAFSYALLLTNYEPKYDQGIIANAEYLAPVVEDTHVDKQPNGYSLHIFSTEPSGNCQASVYAIDVLVYPTGRWMETNKVLQYIENRC